MRRAHAFFLALLPLGLTTACVSAYAAGYVTVMPYSAEPGDEVEVSTYACRGERAFGYSDAFVAPVRLEADHTVRELQGTARIREGIQPREYRVRVRCDDDETVALGTVDVRDPWKRGHHGDKWKRHGGYERPHSPVHAGGGGTAEVTTAQSPAERFKDALPVAGAGVAALTLAGVALHRRRKAATAETTAETGAGSRRGR
ncbi:hypothetical protein G5C51_24660 [Streptomyces sp. A7024]|uniref:Lipoprotein n=1 Tax=Streptomyces coryli TaxID=1128680 RepID=A0A6G4U715_9ACTN|nr:hypothetical protein [Streptomyces coryli]NGN67087.1 hypothetical protein [Streptomyces coryli]